jgi:hypothetical protein
MAHSEKSKRKMKAQPSEDLAQKSEGSTRRLSYPEVPHALNPGIRIPATYQNHPPLVMIKARKIPCGLTKQADNISPSPPCFAATKQPDRAATGDYHPRL